MTVVLETRIHRYIGDTADTKPTGVPVGSTYLDRETDILYVTYDGTNWVAKDVLVRLVAGSAVFGKVGIDQTTPGTTNKVTTDPISATPAVYNVTCTLADTEYSQVLPTNCRGLDFQCRSAVDVRYAYVTGKVAGSVAPFRTLKANSSYFSLPINQGASPSTLYVASSTAGAVIEIEVWT